VRALAIDSQDRVWVGTDHGVSVLEPDGRLTTYTPENSGLGGDWVEALAIDSQYRVWVATRNFLGAGKETYSLNVLESDGRLTTYTSKNWLGDHITALAIDSQDRVWMATMSRLNVLESDGRLTTYTPENSGLGGGQVFALAIDSQDRVWVATRTGLNVLEPDGNWTAYTSENSGLVGDGVTALAIDSQDRVWAGTNSAGTNTRVNMLDQRIVPPSRNPQTMVMVHTAVSIALVVLVVALIASAFLKATDKHQGAWAIGFSINALITTMLCATMPGALMNFIAQSAPECDQAERMEFGLWWAFPVMSIIFVLISWRLRKDQRHTQAMILIFLPIVGGLLGYFIFTQLMPSACR
jgi:ligand-binding sensor domain-containing protein